MKQCSVILASLLLLVSLLSGCGNASSSAPAPSANSPTASTPTPAPASVQSFDANKSITVVSREDGSGTRGAFVELFEVRADGKDITTEEANITNSTSVMMTTVAGDKYAIGYISLGSLNDTVKAVNIDGAAATVDNIKNGSYKVSRPFTIVTKDGLSDAAQDFIDYIMSADGQAVIEKGGYISVSNAPAYSGGKPSGKIVVAGSSSVTPIMEKLKEPYLAVNTNATMEIQQSDSTTGVNSTIEGICDIGMASRDLKDSEKEKGVAGTVIAIDGIAVIVNNSSPVDLLGKEQVSEIFKGEVTKWSQVIK